MSIEVKDELNNKEEVAVISPEQTAEIREMITTGVLFGRKKSRTHPKMNKFIFTYNKGVAVFDSAQTLSLLDKAIVFIKELVEKKLPILVVGTQPAARDLIEAFAKKHSFAYVKERWLGGTLTNFQTISKRIEYFKKLKSDKVGGKLDKYTKKERLLIDRQLADMSIAFSGVESLTQLPAAVIVVDAEAHTTAVREAKRLRIPIVAIINNDTNPDGLAYPVPANDNLRSSLIWILDRIERGLVNTAPVQ